MDRTHSWELFAASQVDQCESYAYVVQTLSAMPMSLPYVHAWKDLCPNLQKKWYSVDWSDGCVRRTKLKCNGDGFQKYTNVKLPDTSSSWFNRTMSLKECEGLCLKNCSCTAYSNLDISGEGSGCLLWFGILNDMKVFSQDGQDLYIRLTNSELGTFYFCYLFSLDFALL